MESPYDDEKDNGCFEKMFDEQTIGFKGKHKDILRITYKKEGDGFQCDSICSDGYTWSFYFRNVHAPKCFIDKGLSPLHSRVMSLLSQLPGSNYDVGMDNLYISSRLALFAKQLESKANIHGVCRASGRGIPRCIEQQVGKTKKDIEERRGTLKVAKLNGEPRLRDLLAISL